MPNHTNGNLPKNPLVTFNSGYLTLHVYLNQHNGSSYYDIVLFRKIRTPAGTKYKRGANLKPTDLPAAIRLYQEAEKYLKEYTTV